MRKIFLVVLISMLLVINGWRFINGEMVHLPILGTKDISVPFKLDPDFEEILQYIRMLPHDGKILTLPLTDFGYQLLGGTEGGMYMGPSMIGYLTDKKDYVSYNGFGRQGEMLLKFLKEKNYKAIKNIFAVHNIQYVYFNQDPYVFDNFVAFPYQKTKEALPTLDSYHEFLQVLQAEEIFKKGPYFIYKLPEDSYSPILYATNTVIHIKSLAEMEYIFPFYSFASSQLVVAQGKESQIIWTEKIDIYSRIGKDYPVPVWYPFAKWKLSSAIYPLIVFKESKKIGCISGYILPEIDCDIFYSLKRISELERWEGGIPIKGNIVNREDLLNWKEPYLLNFRWWHTYNSWEASLARYIKGVEKTVDFIENADRGLVWETEKKSEMAEILLDNQRMLNLIINNSPKSEKDKAYVKQLIDNIFSYYFEKVRANTYDPSNLEYVIPDTPQMSGTYEILIKNDEQIELKDSVLTIEGKEYRPLVDENDGWLHFGQINPPNKESLGIMKIPLINLSSNSTWQVVNSTSTNAASTQLETVDSGFEGFISQVNNVTSPGHYLFSFDYFTHGDVFEFSLFFSKKKKTKGLEIAQFFQELKYSDSWRKMNAVIEIDKPTDIVIQIKPSGQSKLIDVKNLSFVKLPPHPDIFLRKINAEQPGDPVPVVAFNKINPTKYRVNVRNVSNPYTLVFSTAFNKKWNLIDTTQEDVTFLSSLERFLGRIGAFLTRTFHINTAFINEKSFETWGKRAVAQDSHMVVNGYANGWLVQPADMDRTDYTLVLEITSQRTLYYYLLIAIIALTASIIVMIAVQLARLHIRY